MVSIISLPIYWFVLTPLILFLVLVPGYVVVVYVKQKLEKNKSSSTGRLINKSRVTSYYTSIRPILRDRLQRRSSLNVPTPAKPAATKHLRSASTQLPSSPVKSLLQSPNRHHRRSSADSGNFTNSITAASSPVIISHHLATRPDLLEPPYALYQIQPKPGDIELQVNKGVQLDQQQERLRSHKHYFERDTLEFTKDFEENYNISTSKKSKKPISPPDCFNNNKSEVKDKEHQHKTKKSRHLISPSNHSPFVIKKNTNNNKQGKHHQQQCRIDMPENGEYP